MSDHLAIELRDVHRCGNSRLPLAAEGYVSANVRLDAATEFKDPAAAAGSPLAPLSNVFTKWQELRRETQAVLGITGQSLYDSGAALVLVAEHYAYHDEQTEQKFDNIANMYDGYIKDDTRDDSYKAPDGEQPNGEKYTDPIIP